MEFLIFLCFVGLFGLGVIAWCAYQDFKDDKNSQEQSASGRNELDEQILYAVKKICDFFFKGCPHIFSASVS